MSSNPSTKLREVAICLSRQQKAILEEQQKGRTVVVLDNSIRLFEVKPGDTCFIGDEIVRVVSVRHNFGNET